MLAMFFQEMKYQKSGNESHEGYIEQLGRKAPEQGTTCGRDEEGEE